ncbi:twin-arginine translocation signal domain-containing protein [Laspinema olomoucense]|uniref:twin-arginine translocation signal domain-containing protein n=1 Tax=Laspinema olomoucense TaxID=3231600 RepID=UPI0021BA8322|nr:twin-arginine translocation signal domain-containing protein [Laspinema sp. D3d]MCT7973971.1 twin-arginine translocation signal domain-containing protein [Laspinema sp. D3d]
MSSIQSQPYSNPEPNPTTSAIARRQFLGLSASAVLALTLGGWPQSVSADSNVSVTTTEGDSSVNLNIKERYRIFVPNVTVARGGQATLVLRSGENCTLDIPRRVADQSEFTVKGKGLEGNDIVIVMHTLYEPSAKIQEIIEHEIESAPFIQQVTQENCQAAYFQITEGKYFEDLATLDLLDYVVDSSNLDETIQQRYKIASQSSRLVAIEEAIEKVLVNSELNPNEKQVIRGTHQYVRAGDPVPNFEDLTDLAAIIAGTELSLGLKQYYLQAIATAKAVTADFIIVQLIADPQQSPQLNEEVRSKYLQVYQEVRDGQKVSDLETLNGLDQLIANSNILETCKVIYSLARDRFFEDAASAQEDFGDLMQVANKVKRTGASIVPTAINVLSVWGVKAGTGVTIATLNGGSATNATLAVLGGGSIATGGFGMLGGLAVVTGGAALIGAAGLLSIALVSQMDGQDLKNLGVAGVTGTLAGTAAIFVAWTGASVLGLAGNLSGAAAITATITALGGLNIITGGASLVAFGTSYVVWSVLNGKKKRDNNSVLTGNTKRDKNILHKLESRLYTFIEELSVDDSLFAFLKTKLPQEHYDNSDEVFFAPDIPLDKLTTALTKWGTVGPGEKVLSFVDTTKSHNGKEGIFFTNQGIIWKGSGSSGSVSYPDLDIYTAGKIAEGLLNQEQKSNFADVIWELHNTFKMT